MKRKVLSVLLCAGLAVSMLAGCGSDSSNANKKAESTGSDLEYVKDKGTLVVGVTDFEWIIKMILVSGSDLMQTWRKHLQRVSELRQNL